MKTVDEIAEYLKVSRNTIVTLIKKGKIKAIKVGGQYRITGENLRQFVDESEVRI